MTSIGADELASTVDSSEPDDRQALAVAGLVCQGAQPDVAECVIDELAVEYPGMFEVERMEELTAVQQQFMADAATTALRAEPW